MPANLAECNQWISNNIKMRQQKRIMLSIFFLVFIPCIVILQVPSVFWHVIVNLIIPSTDSQKNLHTIMYFQCWTKCAMVKIRVWYIFVTHDQFHSIYEHNIIVLDKAIYLILSNLPDVSQKLKWTVCLLTSWLLNDLSKLVGV